MDTEQEQQWWWLSDRTRRGHRSDGDGCRRSTIFSIVERPSHVANGRRTLDLKLFGRCLGGAADESEGCSPIVQIRNRARLRHRCEPTPPC
ncbi:hypothetical protein TIFTF001_016962 [Ficus carica]|uniref:Uncharacterized protein n=1 Tax=Ficus carica TaxID=3494 RepID=A0AA88APS4_FICCA|nr:hypothetical protein TIFTF001_016962 [Ficus carica]